VLTVAREGQRRNSLLARFGACRRQEQQFAAGEAADRDRALVRAEVLDDTSVEGVPIGSNCHIGFIVPQGDPIARRLSNQRIGKVVQSGGPDPASAPGYSVPMRDVGVRS